MATFTNPTDTLLKQALGELEDLTRQLESLDRRVPVEFFPDKLLMGRIRDYLACVEGK